MKLPPELQTAYDEAHKWREALVEGGELLTAEAMAGRLGITRHAPSRAVQRRRMFAVELNGVEYYPRFFADPEYSPRRLGNVTTSLGDLRGWSKLSFYSRPRLSLGSKTPLAALGQGQLKLELNAAAGYSER